MAQYGWFRPIEAMFYDALYYHDLPEWFIEPMPDSVDTHRAALVQGEKRDWPFRTHNARGSFFCRACRKEWMSAYTTIVWRARWDTGAVQIIIEKQRCRKCERRCQGHLANDDQIGSTIEWMIKWMLVVFYAAEDEETNSSSDESDEHEQQGPHDSERCVARRKGTCKRCNPKRQRK